jgi:biopolymer transport protein ExbD
MRFKTDRQAHSGIPEVNLVPMMDVLMTVLTFFIIISMSLSGTPIAGLILPKTDGAGVEKGDDKAVLVIGLNSKEEIVLEDKSINVTQLGEAMQKFYTQHPDGVVSLKADKSLTYSQVVKLLKTMRDIGGDQVSLAIDRKK